MGDAAIDIDSRPAGRGIAKVVASQIEPRALVCEHGARPAGLPAIPLDAEGAGKCTVVIEDDVVPLAIGAHVSPPISWPGMQPGMHLETVPLCSSPLERDDRRRNRRRSESRAKATS